MKRGIALIASLFKLLACLVVMVTVQLKPAGVRLVQAQSDFYLNSVELVSPSFFMLYWNYTSTNLTAEIVVRTYGWVSFGILKNSSLQNSDLILAWISGANTVFVDCYYSGNDVFPDPKQNWQLLDSFEFDGYTTIKFTRTIVLSNVDKEHDVDIETGTPIVSYSWGTADPFKFINYNSSNLGFMPVPLLSTANVNPYSIASETVYTLRYSVPSITLPSDQTEYFYCMPVSLPVNTSTQNFHLTQVGTTLFTPSLASTFKSRVVAVVSSPRSSRAATRTICTIGSSISVQDWRTRTICQQRALATRTLATAPTPCGGRPCEAHVLFSGSCGPKATSA